MFDPAFIKLTAQALGADPSHIEKDWHVVRALGVITGVQVPGVTPVFSGGTSLSAAWRIINRFSEDIDFKVIIDAPNPSAARTRRSRFREAVLDALAEAEFALDGEVLVGNMSRFFRASFHYGATLPPAAGIRPTLQIEMTFGGTLMEPTAHPVQSLLARAAKDAPEMASVMCVHPVETAADKISALAWRVKVRDRSSPTDDPSIVRHLHDLAALATAVRSTAGFAPLARRVLADDAKRTKEPSADGIDLLRNMLPRIVADPVWREEYERFVQAVSFGPDSERIGYEQAMAACERLAAQILDQATA